jgi:hypothetical protein
VIQEQAGNTGAHGSHADDGDVGFFHLSPSILVFIQDISKSFV